MCDHCDLHLLMAKDLHASMAFEADVHPSYGKESEGVKGETSKHFGVRLKYATAEYMLAHPDEFGGIREVLGQLAKLTHEG